MAKTNRRNWLISVLQKKEREKEAKSASTKTGATGAKGAGEDKRRRSKTADFFVWILLGLLVLGLAGFGIGNFATSMDSVGSVGDEEITVEEYVRALQNEIRDFSIQSGQNISVSEALAVGLDRRALQRLVIDAALDNEAQRIGLSVGDETVLAELRKTSQFLGTDGTFDRVAYEFALERSGMTASEYDDAVREQRSRSLLERAVITALPGSPTYAEQLVDYYYERRDITWAEVTPYMLDQEIPEPGQADLIAHYDANPEEFTQPGAREITYAWITPSMLSDSMPVDEEAARTLFNQRTREYNVPERRIVERLVFPDGVTAETAYNRLQSGEVDFDALAAERGVLLDDIDLGVVEPSDLSTAAAEEVFAMQEPGVTAPAQTSLGPAIFRINAVLAARNTAFEEARAELESELALDQAKRAIIDSSEQYEDLLAGGATLEELAAETDLELGSLAYNSDSEELIAGFDDFRAAADGVSEGDFPVLLEMSDGGVFAIRLDGIREAELQPFAEVKGEVETSWRTHSIKQGLDALAETARNELASGKDFPELGLIPQVQQDVLRTGLLSAAPVGTAARIFGARSGEVIIVDDGERVAVARLDAIRKPDRKDEEIIRVLSALNSQSESGLRQDAYILFAAQMERDAELSLNYSVLDAIHSQYQ